MTDPLVPVAAFALAFVLAVRSLGAGLAAVLAVGYVNGVIRANMLNVYTTFMFDAAVLGLYAGAAARGPDVWRAAGGTTGRFVGFLVGWPVVLAAMPVNHPLVQLVALRATVWFLPMVLVARRLTAADLLLLARATAGLNLVALGGGLYVYAFGLEGLFPQNSVTEIMYRSKDVAGGQSYRIPSLFLNAHQYGVMMVTSLPLLLDPLLRPGGRLADRALALAGIAAAVGGVLMCAARTPMVVLALTGVVFWALTGLSVRVGLLIGLVIAGGAYLAATNERFQRAAELGDTEAVTSRVQGSANEEFLDLLAGYPLGAGLGSSVGTSVPYFLADVAPKQIGLENEYSRILVDQGWLGLFGWVGFVLWLLAVPPRYDPRRPWAAGRALMYALVVVSWATTFIGTGLLSFIPASVLLLAYMGVLSYARDPHPAGPR